MEAISEKLDETETNRQRQRNKEGMEIMRRIQVFVFGVQKFGSSKNMGYTPTQNKTMPATPFLYFVEVYPVFWRKALESSPYGRPQVLL